MYTNPMIPALKSLKLYGMAYACASAYQLKTARFPAYRDLSGFDFTSSTANKVLIHQRCVLRLLVHSSS